MNRHRQLAERPRDTVIQTALDRHVIARSGEGLENTSIRPLRPVSW